MLAMESSRELALQDGRDASKRHEKAAITVTKCCFVNQSDPPPPPAAAGSDEPIMNGSNESVFMTRGMSTESNVTLPRQSSNLWLFFFIHFLTEHKYTEQFLKKTQMSKMIEFVTCIVEMSHKTFGCKGNFSKHQKPEFRKIFDWCETAASRVF